MGLKKWLITGCEVSGYSLLYVRPAQQAIAKAEAARIDKPVITRLPSMLLYLSCSVVSLIFNLLEEKMLSLTTRASMRLKDLDLVQ